MAIQEIIIALLVATLAVVVGRVVCRAIRCDRSTGPKEASMLESAASDDRVNDRKALILDRARTNGHVSNDEVEALFHVSHTTAWRLLDELEKEGKVRQSGATGRGVTYELTQ